MKRLAIAVIAVMLAAGCSGSTQTSVHEKLLSYFPQYMARKAFETKNNLVFYSYNISQIRSGTKDVSDVPNKEADHLALVRAWDFATKPGFKCENPYNFDGFAACTYNGIQVATPVNDFEELMKKGGAVIDKTDKVSFYKIKPLTADTPQYPTQAASDESVFIATKSLRQDTQVNVTQVLAGNDKPITNFDSVKLCLDELSDFPAVELVFVSESYTVKADNKTIMSPAMSPDQIDALVPAFGNWGRNNYLQNIAFGSRWANGSETVKGVFVYTSEENAAEDFANLSQFYASIPSFYNGKPWFEKMNMTTPQFRLDGRKVIAEFDMKEKSDVFQFPMLLQAAEKFGDWGWLWLK